MKQAVLSGWDLPMLSVVALILFVACFAAYVFWAFSKANKPMFEKVSQIPLEEPRVKGTNV